MNRKIAQLFQPRLQLYFVCLIVFALLSALYSVPLAVTELVIVLGLGLYNRENSRRRRVCPVPEKRDPCPYHPGSGVSPRPGAH